MISLRLPGDLERKLNRISKDEKISKSEVVKKALTSYFEGHVKKETPYDLGKNLFGKYGSGNKNLSKDRKKLLKEMLREKRSH